MTPYQYFRGFWGMLYYSDTEDLTKCTQRLDMPTPTLGLLDGFPGIGLRTPDCRHCNQPALRLRDITGLRL